MGRVLRHLRLVVDNGPVRPKPTPKPKGTRKPDRFAEVRRKIDRLR